MFHMKVPSHLWGEYMLIACYLINHVPSSILKFRTLYFILYPTSDLFSMIPWVFECVCFLHVHHPENKLAQALKCVSMGISKIQKGYKCFHPPSHKYYVNSDVTFFEHTPYFASHGTSLDKSLLAVPAPIPVSSPLEFSSLPIASDDLTIC